MKIQSVREDFPIFKDKQLIYLDSAATSQKPQTVIDALTGFYSTECGTVHRAIYTLAASATTKYNNTRGQVARFIGAKDPNEIIFTKGTTDSINLLALAHQDILQEGDEIILSVMEHHSNIVPWQLLAKKKKVVLRFIPINERAELDLEAFSKLLSPRTKLVSVAHIANSTGTINPIAQITEMAHAHGAKVLIDAAQSTAHIPLNVQELDVDYLALSGHKAFGPTGIGIFYGKYDLLDSLPPVQGGGDMIETVTLAKTTFAKPPLKFEAGTPPIAQVIGLSAALDYIESLGFEHIQSHEHQLLTYATEKLQEIPNLKIIGTAKEKSGIISFVIEGIHHLDLGTLLDLEGIAIRTGHHCAQPLLARFGLTGTNRVSFAPFNTLDEIDRLIEALNKARKSLQG
ncbi:MAG: cysteine desulfurase [Simkaniaceae bacterium]|nr:cysteine desulfurase [Candidatus Sacchlamyda saccharinae]